MQEQGGSRTRARPPLESKSESITTEAIASAQYARLEDIGVASACQQYASCSPGQKFFCSKQQGNSKRRNSAIHYELGFLLGDAVAVSHPSIAACWYARITAPNDGASLLVAIPCYAHQPCRQSESLMYALGDAWVGLRQRQPASTKEDASMAAGQYPLPSAVPVVLRNLADTSSRL